MSSINREFSKRSGYISLIGKQLQTVTQMELTIARKRLLVDYRIISIDSEESSSYPTILLPGFGSGWEGMAELGFSLACEGRRIILVSLPGYGNSDDPPEWYYNTSSFHFESNIISHLRHHDGLREYPKLHLIGHSMGAEILASFASRHPESTASLTLLNPAGIRENENFISQNTRFVLSGVYTATEFGLRMILSREKDYETALREYIPETKSPFTRERLRQRLAEARKLKQGRLIGVLRSVPKTVPIMYISGMADSVYPPKKYLPLLERGLGRSVIKSLMEGLRHNTTLASDEIVAANIEHYLTLAEK